MRIERPEPQRLSPAICAAVAREPRPGEGAGYPEPVTPLERDAAAAADAYILSLRSWGRRGWALVEKAQERCDLAGDE